VENKLKEGPIAGPGFGPYRHKYSGVIPCHFEVAVDLVAYQHLNVHQQLMLDVLLDQADYIVDYWSTTPAVDIYGNTIDPNFMEVTNYQTT